MGLLGRAPNYGMLDPIQRHSMANRRDGNAIKNPDGSVSTTRSGSVNDPRLNNGATTVIPFVYDGQEVGYEEAVERAVASGEQWPAFDGHEAATKYSKASSAMMRPLADVAREMEAQPSSEYGNLLERLKASQRPQDAPPMVRTALDRAGNSTAYGDAAINAGLGPAFATAAHMAQPNNWLSMADDAGQYWGDKTLDYTGSPLAATAVHTGLSVLGDPLDTVPLAYGGAAALGAGALGKMMMRNVDMSDVRKIADSRQLGMVGNNADQIVRRGDGVAMSQADDIADPLIAQHNLSQANVLHADRLGGLPMPSIAATKVDTPMNNFGDVSLLGGEDLVTPSRNNLVFPADAYTARYPHVVTELSDADFNKLTKAMGEPYGLDQAHYGLPRDAKGDSFGYWDGDSSGGVEAAVRGDTGQARYLWEKGEMPDIKDFDSASAWQTEVRKRINKDRDGWDAWVGNASEHFGLEPQRKIFKGYTNAGNRRYSPETLENVVKEMKKDMVGSDGGAGVYGAGALRANVTPKFKNIKQLKKARDRIVSKEDMDVFKESTNQAFTELAEKIGRYSDYQDSNPFIAMEVNVSRFQEVAAGQARWDEYFPDIPDELKKEAGELVDMLRNGPTEYFEAKPKRGVSFGEFSVALVPKDASDEVVKALASKGLRVERYADEADRVAKIKKQNDLFFSFVGTLGAGGAAKSLNEDNEMANGLLSRPDKGKIGLLDVR